MFTGLIEQIGTVSGLEQREFGLRFSVHCLGWSELPKLGASIAISGCCLTVVTASHSTNGIELEFDIVQESIQCTNLGSMKPGDSINIEQSLIANSRIGGHFVQGHIDCVEQVIQHEVLKNGDHRLRLSMESIDVDTVISKGSITIDGVALTIAKVDQEWFEVVLIPTTLKETTLRFLEQGDSVNIETDILIRTVAQVVRRMRQT